MWDLESTFGFFGFVILIAGIIGWVMNVIEIAESSVITGMVVARVCGVFLAPLGAVLGYL